MSTWVTKSSKIVYENPWILVREDQVIRPSGEDGLYGVVESKSPGVFVIPIDDEGNTYIIRQEHYTTRKMTWQCVAGRTDGEPEEVAARRELLEEAGLRADSIEILSKLHSASGTTTFQTTLCLATGLTPDLSHFDGDEVSEVKKAPLSDIKDMIMRGDITDTESIAAFFMVIEYYARKGQPAS